MRTKQSSSANEIHCHAPQDGPGDGAPFSGDGLLHDARNLVGAIGLYCDLLSMPGVLKPEHRRYSDELRLLGTRSRQMIEHLMDSLAGAARGPSGAALDQTVRGENGGRAGGHLPADFLPLYRSAPISLRAVIERSSGLLSRVADGRAIEVRYGPAAEMPVRIAEESVERILVNLVRNGSAALGEEEGAVRISVGYLARPVEEAQAWPFERVRLVVEDAGCGMDARQLEALLAGRYAPARGNHGIGFRVVRELVAASSGELRVASAPGLGTRIQIEWPVAQMVASTAGESGRTEDFRHVIETRNRLEGEEFSAQPWAYAGTTGGTRLRTTRASEERKGAH